MAISSEEFRKQIAEQLEISGSEDIGLLAIALKQFNFAGREDKELSRDMKLYREFANANGMSFMELYLLNEIFTALDGQDRKEFLLDPEQFIPNFSLLGEFGRALEGYDENELVRLNHIIEVKPEESELLMPLLEGDEKDLGLAVINSLPPKSEKLKDVIIPYLSAAAHRSTTAIATERFTVVGTSPSFKIAPVGAVYEIVIGGSSETFINKFLIPHSSQMLTISYLKERAKK
ncbi:hypothetical protein HZA76_02455 [Candidatus Roizmanbacteria bacterium]|nr:hypothetical protein [Candidatus Roizmanbacteria bacterium]